jgi:hypothetical protein
MEGLELLRQMIGRELYGDSKNRGRIYTILGSQSYEMFLVSKGVIQGYEGALDMIEHIIQQLSEPPDRPQPGRVMN